ncbi:MAG: prephenate dehydratase [Burkholderiaceae bacterium]|nr:prephenate dehydratase [Burkholderiaceae bacterium]
MSSDRGEEPVPARVEPGSEGDERLGALRQRIDAVDARLLELLNERARIAREVGELKRETGAPVFRPEREAQVLARVRQNNTGPLGGEGIVAIYREVISACRELERRQRVAYLGPAGTFSEQALVMFFGSGVEAIACPTIDEVFRSTEGGGADFGVVAVENSSEGAVNRSLDLLLQTPLRICGETSIAVRHNLMNRSGLLADARRICAHPQALAQCVGWLDRNCPGVERSPVASNAEGARMAAANDGVAAVAGDSAATRYALQIVSGGIQDDPNNRTRFAIVGRYDCDPSGDDQTSLILSVPDRAGAVHALIEPLARHGVSMKRFESRPARHGTWEYYFYIDVIGHQRDEKVSAALSELRANAAFFKVVGSYPRAT